MLPTKPDEDNVLKRRRTVYTAYTYEDLCRKRERVGDQAFYDSWMEQWYAWKRHEGWKGYETEVKGYFRMLTDTELYIHSRRFLPHCVCLTCAYCDSAKFWKWIDRQGCPCAENMDGTQLSAISTVKSPEGRYNLISSCPCYERRDDHQLYEAYIGSPLWREIRRQIIEDSPYCEGCGRGRNEDGVNLVVHHKSYDNLCFEDETNDCAVLCGECHMELHRDPEAYWDKYSVIIPAHKRGEA